jgi:hypothetical protein
MVAAGLSSVSCCCFFSQVESEGESREREREKKNKLTQIYTKKETGKKENI